MMMKVPLDDLELGLIKNDLGLGLIKIDLGLGLIKTAGAEI